VTDPQSNVTVYTFSGIYETQRQIYQGAVAPANLLQTVVTCYNTVSPTVSSCPTATVAAPINEAWSVRQLPGGKWATTYDAFNALGLPIQHNDYDWGTNA